MEEAGVTEPSECPWNNSAVFLVSIEASNLVCRLNIAYLTPSLRKQTVPERVAVRGVATGWTGVDMSTPLLPEVVPEIDANPVSFN